MVNRSLPLGLTGDSGTGKSHLLIALGTETAMAGFRVAAKPVNELVEGGHEVHSPSTRCRARRTSRWDWVASKAGRDL